MALDPLWTGSQLLRKLLTDYLDGTLEAATFCQDVEEAYNDADNELTPAEQPIFEKLFDEVVWFSPFPRKEWEYPRYRDEAEIRSAAVRAAEQLSIISCPLSTDCRH